jgi:uncharacterized membrane protein
MTTPESDQQAQPEAAPEAQPDKPTEPEQTELPIEPTEEESPEDLPAVKEKIRKLNSEAKKLRERLKEQEPLVAAAQEAERAKMTELDRERADNQALKDQLAQRDTELLLTRYLIPNEYVEFIGEGSFEEKEARAKKVGEMVRSKNEPQERPPTDRPVESLKPGASPSTPPREDHSYPAGWGFQPERA